MNNKGSGLSAEVLSEIKHLWENTELTATEIGARYGVSRTSIIGYAQRGEWVSFTPGTYHKAETTLASRLDALHKTMDQLLANTEETIKNRFKYKRDPAIKKKAFKLFPMERSK